MLKKLGMFSLKERRLKGGGWRRLIANFQIFEGSYLEDGETLALPCDRGQDRRQGLNYSKAGLDQIPGENVLAARPAEQENKLL